MFGAEVQVNRAAFDTDEQYFKACDTLMKSHRSVQREYEYAAEAFRMYQKYVNSKLKKAGLDMRLTGWCDINGWREEDNKGNLIGVNDQCINSHNGYLEDNNLFVYSLHNDFYVSKFKYSLCKNFDKYEAVKVNLKDYGVSIHWNWEDVYKLMMKKRLTDD